MMTKKPKGEEFDGRSSEMKGDTPWLASEDLMGLGDVKVKIVACHRYKEVEFDAGRKEPVVYTLQFEGKQKQLVLNSTNRRKLVDKYGPNVKDWKGNEIVLYVDPHVRMMGKLVCGIRIR